ncbi:MAG: CooT family nickel-binding protein [Nitrospirae bacterium]|nr:CooT family nickel-binding protein [Nitrospirota bacterium]MBI5695592.1 CooT family nickel-binding protein [Nitrospirota bacterium]
MCETNAYIRAGGIDEVLLESVARIEVAGEMLRITGIFGDRKEVRGRIVEVNFQGGRVLIELL